MTASRVVIEGVTPQVDGGRFPVKRVVGETVDVKADLFADGHDLVSAVLRYRADGDTDWREVAMEPLAGDRFQGSFQVAQLGEYRYTVEAWIDRFRTWHRDFCKRVAANQVSRVDILVGAELIAEAAGQALDGDRQQLAEWSQRLTREDATSFSAVIADSVTLPALMQRCSPRDFATTYDVELRVKVDRERARYSTWYEMFPRSCSPEPGRHGTLQDVENRLPYVAEMGFDVLYLPPIHPIGRTFRKGKNNTAIAGPEDVGSPWAIGSEAGGHKSIHPQLGTLEDFDRLVKAAGKLGIEIALDIAFQCSPDHPYVKEHPEWFRRRPDGTIQYAENPPKKYQDIYPFDFECEQREELWDELKSVFLFWIERGVRIFRVDNPHTKPFPFWEWCLGEISRQHPDVLFLAEAFTRPTLKYRLAKLGFSQSYTYFAWRNTKHELTTFLTELGRSPVRDFLRANFWPNTPDILPEYLQVGGRPAFMTRLVLAATLSSNYGIYGPPFEHAWCSPREPGSEEYLDSEKYLLHVHDLHRPDSLKDFIARVNQLRREHRVLQSNEGLAFHEINNDELICYSKVSPDRKELMLVVVNLDPHHTQSGWVYVPLKDLGLDESHPYQMHDLLSDARYLWHGPRNFVELNPHVVPAHMFAVRRRVRSERDFEYYL